MAAQQITAYRYWFDGDFGNATTVSNNYGSNYSLVQDADVSSLSNGLHVYHVSFKSSNNKWSAVSSSFFFKQAIVTTGQAQYQYWFDGGFNTATIVNISPNFNYALITDFDVSSLSIGLHTFHIRFRPTGGAWSSTSSSFFYKQELTSNGQAQYQFWFDKQYEQATITNTTADSSFEFINDINVDAFSNGLHTFHIRFRPTGGAWSSTSSSFFFKQGPTSSGQASYQYWFDNNSANATNISLATTTNLEVLSDIDVSTLSNGLHILHIRFKPDGGQWSVVKSDFFFKGIPGFNAKITQYRYWFDDDLQAAKNFYYINPVSIDFIDRNDIDVRNLNYGSHIISFQVKDNYGNWSSIVKDSMNKAGQTIVGNTYPQILLNTTTYISGEPLMVNVLNITPGAIAKISIKSAGSQSDLRDTSFDAIADLNGKARLTSVITGVYTNGKYLIDAYDVQTKKKAPQRFFIVANPINNNSNDIYVTSPGLNDVFQAGQRIGVNWYDRMKLKYGNTSYPLCNRSAERSAKYKLVLIDTLTGATVLQKDIVACGPVLQTFSQNTYLDGVSPGVYKIGLTDLYSGQISFGLPFKVSSQSINVITELIWDKSFPIPSNHITPSGVAADGVSRILIRVTNPTPSVKVMRSAEVSLSYNDNSEDDKMGTLKVSSVKNSYSLEANTGSSLTVVSNSLADDGAFWFWYKAPDDFARNSTDYTQGVRTVYANVNITFTDNSVESSRIPIRIVRPVLFLAHGLGGSEHTWDDFEFNFRNVRTPFIYATYTFKKIADVKLCGGCSYNENANRLVNPVHSGYPESSIQFAIKKLRSLGYACNRVDYVCHSMGGDMIRQAATVQPYKNLFYGLGADTIYRNYSAGFVNKFISLNTPHFGSPVADLLEDVVKIINEDGTIYSPFTQLGTKFFDELLNILNDYSPNSSLENLITSFVQIDKSSFTPKLAVAPAIKDLRVPRLQNGGGVTLQETPFRNHLIVGQIDQYNLACYGVNGLENSVLPVYVKIAKMIIKAYSFSSELKAYFTGQGLLMPQVIKLLNENDMSIVCSICNWYFSKFGYNTFFQRSDLIVPIQSQVANQSTNQSNISIFYGIPHIHTRTHGSIDVGDKVMALLNAPIDSTCFSDIIPASIPTLPADFTSNTNSDGFRRLNITTDKPIRYIKDTAKFKITSPLSNNPAKVDSVLSITLKLNDTLNYVFTELNCAGRYLIESDKVNEQQFKVPISPIANKMSFINAKAQFETSDSIFVLFDTMTIKFNFNDTVRIFQVSPNSKIIGTGESYQPLLLALTDSAVISLENSDTAINVIVGDTSIVYYDKNNNSFVGKNSGSTWAKYQYKTFTDTIYLFNGSIDQDYRALCAGSNISIFASSNDTSAVYQWQEDRGSGFTNINDSSIYSGTQTDELRLISLPTSYYGNKYRCIITTSGTIEYSEPKTIQFISSWTGSLNSEWENPTNWNCGQVPDENTDVIINANTPNIPVVNSNAACRSLQLRSGIITIKNGKELKIMK